MACVPGGKKRLIALAEWHWTPGGGGAYCGGCPSPCAECVYTVCAPQTVEGAQIWDLVIRSAGQLRTTMAGVIGFDMAAVLALAAALGINALLVAEAMPEIEAVMLRAIRAGEGDG